MTLGAERRAVQNPFIKYATEAGWTYLKREDALVLRNGGVESPLLDAVFVDYVHRLNPGIVTSDKVHDLAKQLRRVKPTIDGNFDAWKFLKGLRTVFVEAEKRERNVRLLDPERPENNQFHVTDEFTFSNGVPPNIRADIVFFVNGVPILIIETKSARDTDGISCRSSDPI
jgi:type I restriction enzyme, R subunit